MGQQHAKFVMSEEDSPPPLYTYDPINGVVPIGAALEYRQKDAPQLTFFPEDIEEFSDGVAATGDGVNSAINGPSCQATSPGSVSNPYGPAVPNRRASSSSDNCESDMGSDDYDDEDIEQSTAATELGSTTPLLAPTTSALPAAYHVPSPSATYQMARQEMSIFELPASMEPIGEAAQRAEEIERPGSGLYDEVYEEHDDVADDDVVVVPIPPSRAVSLRKIEPIFDESDCGQATQYDPVCESAPVAPAPPPLPPRRHTSVSTKQQKVVPIPSAVPVVTPVAVEPSVPVLPSSYKLEYTPEEEAVVQQLSYLVMIDTVLWESAPDSEERRRAVLAAWHRISLTMGVNANWTFERYIRLWRTLSTTLMENPQNMTWKYFKYLSFFLPLFRTQAKPSLLLTPAPAAVPLLKKEIPSCVPSPQSNVNHPTVSPSVAQSIAKSASSSSLRQGNKRVVSPVPVVIKQDQDVWEEFENDYIPPQKRLTMSPKRMAPPVPRRLSLGGQMAAPAPKSGGLFARIPLAQR